MRSCLALGLPLIFAALLPAFAVTCPAGMPIGNVELNLKREAGGPLLPLSQANSIDEGDRILYAPVFGGVEKRPGKVTVVLVAKKPLPDEKLGFVVLDPQQADEPAQWVVPFPSNLAVFVYGPSGLSTGKVRGFLARDTELIAQLADYAEKTAQTEQLLQALSHYEANGPSENVGAALQGFARNYGVNNKLDRNAPLDQQTLAVIRNLNPALSAYDPISPTGSQRLSQTAGLATIVAGMFFGSTVGLAAGSTAMALNMKTILFPNSDFRSMYAQPVPGAIALCGKREASHGRARLAYLWAMRAPGPDPPQITIDSLNHIPANLRSVVRVTIAGNAWPLVGRARNWTLKSADNDVTPVSVGPVPDRHGLEIDLSKVNLKPGVYTLHGEWDWDPFPVQGHLHLYELPSFVSVNPTPASQNRLRQFAGKQVVTLKGADFEFVEKISLQRKGDRYGTPVAVPFTLPLGPRRGPQESIEMEIDTSSLAAGQYSLFFVQPDNRPREASLRILNDPPKLARLPLKVHAGETQSTVLLEGQDLAAIESVQADGFQIQLDPPGEGRRLVRLTSPAHLAPDTAYDLRLMVEGYAEPIVLSKALLVAGPRPRVTHAAVSLPPDLPVAIRDGELPAGFFLSALLSIDNATPSAAATLGCDNLTAPRVTAAVGAPRDGVKLESVQQGSYYLSFDPGRWPGGCNLSLTFHNGDGGSDPRPLGRVVRAPRIESFRLTGEEGPDSTYIGILTGRDLELIEKVGWNGMDSVTVPGLPTPLPGESYLQQLRIRLSWPSPVPHAPLFVWLRGETDGRATRARY